MIFAERRLAVILCVFMLTVFFLCVLEYKFITAAAIISGILTVAVILFSTFYFFRCALRNNISSVHTCAGP